MMKKNTRMFCSFFFEMIFFLLGLDGWKGFGFLSFSFLFSFFSFVFVFVFVFFFLCLCSCFAFLFLSDHSFSISTYYRPAIHHIHFSKVFLISNNNNNNDDNDDKTTTTTTTTIYAEFLLFHFFFFVFVFRFPFVLFFSYLFFLKSSYSFFRTSQNFCHHKKGFLNRYILYQIYSITSRVQPTTHNPHAFLFFSLLSPTQQKPQHTHSLSHTLTHAQHT